MLPLACRAPNGPCQASDECLDSEICVDRWCRAVCNQSSDCRASEQCVDGVCLPSSYQEELDASQPGHDATLDAGQPDSVHGDTAVSRDHVVGVDRGADAAPGDAGSDAGRDAAAGDASQPDAAAACSTAARPWTRRWGGGGIDQAAAVVADSQGNIVVAGSFYDGSALDLGGGPLPNAGSMDIWIAKLDPDGRYIWSASFGSSSWDYAHALAVTASDDIVMAGRISGSVDFGRGSVGEGSGYQPFVVKLDGDGGCVWSNAYTGTSVEPAAVAVSSTGDIALVGSFDTGSVNLGGDTFSTIGFGISLGIVGIYDSDGGHLFSNAYGGETVIARPQGVVALPGGTFVMAGEFGGALDFGGGELSASGGGNAFLVELDTAGNDLWHTSFSSSGLVVPLGLAAAPGGELALTGEYRGLMDLGGGSLPEVDSGIFVAAFDPLRAHTWSGGFGANDGYVKMGEALAFDSQLGVTVAGEFAGALPLGGASYSSTSLDVFIARFGPSGVLDWSAHIGGSGREEVAGVALSCGAPVVAGCHDGSLVIDEVISPSVGSYDAFVHALPR